MEAAKNSWPSLRPSSSLSMLLSASSAARLRTPARPRRPLFPGRRKLASCSFVFRSGGPVLVSQPSDLFLCAQSSSPPPHQMPSFRLAPELGLLSLLFVLSTIAFSFFSLVIISFPALNAFQRLKISTEELSKVVSEEVPGTLSSLKLSGLEINDLTDQLNNLRQRISGNQYRKKVGTNKRSSRVGRIDSITN